MTNKSTGICIWRGRFSEWSYQLQDDFKVTLVMCNLFYYFLWFKKINFSLISTTEKDQVNVGRYTGRKETMYVANGNYTFD